MKGVATLIRLHQWHLDQRRRELGALERLKASFLVQLDKLEQDLVVEQQIAAGTEIGMFAYANYAVGVVSRRNNLNKSIDEVDPQIASKHAEVTSAFHEVKRYEIALREAERRREAEVARREQIEMNEVALNIHRGQSMDSKRAKRESAGVARARRMARTNHDTGH